jgi:hypothetical protein
MRQGLPGGRAKLRGVYKNTYDEGVTELSPLLHEVRVPLVEIAHGRDKSNGPALFTAGLGENLHLSY